MCSEDGYALPIVLLISLIIIVLGVGIAWSVRNRIDIAIELNDRNSAYLKSYSAMNEVIYHLVTSTFTPTGIKFQPGNEKETGWNLYGRPIKISDGVTIRLRDTAGMVSVLFAPDLLRDLVEYAGGNSKKAVAFLDSLADWQDKNDFKRLNGAESFDYRTAGYAYVPRNFYIQVPREIMLIKNFNKGIFGKIKGDLTYWGGTTVNFLTMSRRLLKALLHNDSLVERIIKLRGEGRLTEKVFRDLTGIQATERNIFMPNGLIQVDITAHVGKTVDRIKAVLAKRQWQRRPYLVTAWRE